MGHGLDIHRQDRAGTAHPDGVVELLHLSARLAELVGDGFQMLGDHILDQHIAAGGSSCYHIGTGFDLIGNDGIVGAVHHIHAVDLDDIGAGAADIRAHGVEEVCQIHNMRLLGNIFHDGNTLGLDRCQHYIDGSAHRYHIKVDVFAPELLAVHGHHAIVHRYIGAQGLEALDMLVNGAHTAEVAAAGQRYIGPSAAAQQRAQEIIGGTQGLCQLMGNHRFPMWVVSISTVVLSSRRTLAPRSRRILRSAVTSLILGIFSMTQTSRARTVAGMIATTAFFAPLIVTSPLRTAPPVTTYFSIPILSCIV